jgi:RNA polymerase sigma-70 factor (ECF subfamily)
MDDISISSRTGDTLWPDVPRATQRGPAPATESGDDLDIRFATYFHRYAGLLVGYLRRLTRCRMTAEDLAQQVWLKLYESLQAGRYVALDDLSFRSVLFAMARNLHLDECVRKHSSARTSCYSPASIDAFLAEQGASSAAPCAIAEMEQLQRAVHRAVDELPPSQRQVIELWMSRASIEEMVAATAAPRDTVLSRKKYALRRLRGLLPAEFCASWATARTPRPKGR